MCGITGFWESADQSAPELSQLVRRMATALRHRGPDSGADWVDPEQGIALAHRRLAILDLSDDGAQPMVSSCGRWVMVFNGEVYNFKDLRKELEGEGARFRGSSDSEVILELMARRGVEQAVQKFVGMFAIALWDRKQRRLALVRDRLGIKPLYWTKQQGRVAFGSELSALRSMPRLSFEIDPNALATFFRHNYIGAPQSIYRGVYKLGPGEIAWFEEGREPSIGRYWDARVKALEGQRSPFSGSEQQALEQFEELARDAVGLRMVADVPLGAFLSGGIDSSAVVALMQEQSSRPIKTFTIGFEQDRFDESSHARAVAAHLKTEHTELVVSDREAQEVIPLLPRMFDEPFSDSSQIPTFLVSRLARQHVTVSLSGDGGDELFGGYTRFHMTEKLVKRFGRIPSFLRRGIASGMQLLPSAVWNGLGRAVGRPRAGDRAQRLAELLSFRDAQEFYRELVSHWKQPEQLVPGAIEAPSPLLDPSLRADFKDELERMMYLDSVTYLPGDILTKVDRASMAVSLEARVPLLDHRLYEFAWTLPRNVRVGDAPGKRLLRKLLARRVPSELFERPKKGFGVPLGEWLLGPLRDWAEDLLSEQALGESGLLAAAPIRQAWQEHVDGSRERHYYLWDVLMFQSWQRAQSEDKPVVPQLVGQE